MRRRNYRAFAPGQNGEKRARAALAQGNELFIYDFIDPYADEYWGGVSASMVRDALSGMSGEITVRVNSPGGDVYDGITILNLLRTYNGKVTVQIDGLAASAASFICMAGNEIVIMPNAEMMIHDALMMTIGNAAELRKDADDLDRISENIASAYALRAGGDQAAWRGLMLAETWFSADEAVAHNLADRIGEVDATAPEPATLAAKAIGNAWELPYATRYSSRREAPIPAIVTKEELPGDATVIEDDWAASIEAALTERNTA